MSTEKFKRNGYRTQTESEKLNGVLCSCRVIIIIIIIIIFIISIIIIIIIIIIISIINNNDNNNIIIIIIIIIILIFAHQHRPCRLENYKLVCCS